MGIRFNVYVSQTCINQVDIQKMFVLLPLTEKSLSLGFWECKHEEGRKQLLSQLPLVIKPTPG